MKKNSKFGKIYLTIILIINYIPIILATVYSFNESKLTTRWTGFSLKWYRDLIRDRDIQQAVLNSIILAVLSCLVATVIAVPAAVTIYKRKPVTGNIMEKVSSIPIMIPEIILGMVFLSTFSLMRLPFGMLTLVLGHATFCIPYIYSQSSARLQGMDSSLQEAAMDLGASRARAFFDITLPLLAPAVFSGMLLSFAMSFDDVVISIFVNGPEVNLLPLRIYTRMKTGITPEINALNTVMLLIIGIVLIVYKLLTANKKEESDI